MGQVTTVGKVATSVKRDEQGTLTVRYHWTDVVTVTAKGKITLNHGGYMTHTTKTRMNQTSFQFGLGFQVYQKDFHWFVAIDGHVIDFDHNPLVIRDGAD